MLEILCSPLAVNFEGFYFICKEKRIGHFQAACGKSCFSHQHLYGTSKSLQNYPFLVVISTFNKAVCSVGVPAGVWGGHLQQWMFRVCTKPGAQQLELSKPSVLQLLSDNTSACSSRACFSQDQFQTSPGLELKTQGHSLTLDGWQFAFLHFCIYLNEIP